MWVVMTDSVIDYYHSGPIPQRRAKPLLTLGRRQTLSKRDLATVVAKRQALLGRAHFKA